MVYSPERTSFSEFNEIYSVIFQNLLGRCVRQFLTLLRIRITLTSFVDCSKPMWMVILLRWERRNFGISTHITILISYLMWHDVKIGGIGIPHVSKLWTRNQYTRMIFQLITLTVTTSNLKEAGQSKGQIIFFQKIYEALVSSVEVYIY